jgi:Tat protein secretion system quality control protein TatD with DNase activity
MEDAFVDTHCNIPNVLSKLGFATFAELERLLTQVNSCLSVSSDSPSHEATFQLLEQVDAHDNNIFGCFGIHPLYCHEQWNEATKELIVSKVPL